MQHKRTETSRISDAKEHGLVFTVDQNVAAQIFGHYTIQIPRNIAQIIRGVFFHETTTSLQCVQGEPCADYPWHHIKV